MEQTKLANSKQTRFKVKEPAMYDCIMHNDDVTTMDFVVNVIQHIFHKRKNVAETLMMDIHNTGSAVVGTYHLDIAESKAAYAMGVAKANGFPLKVSTKKAR